MKCGVAEGGDISEVSGEGACVKLVRYCSAISLVFASAVAASIAKGVVVYDRGCSFRFIVDAPLGYALLEWFGGYSPSTGDIITGDFETYGIRDVYDVTARSTVKVWIEDFWLSKDAVLEKLKDKCG